jgi:hypothetical protein
VYRPSASFARQAYYPPHIIGDEDQNRTNELLDYFQALDEERRETAIALIRTLYEQQGPYAAEIRPDDEE